MRNLTERGILVFFSTVITLILLLSFQSCSSIPPCKDLSGEELRKCHEQSEARRVHREMVRSGFYDRN